MGLALELGHWDLGIRSCMGNGHEFSSVLFCSVLVNEYKYCTVIFYSLCVCVCACVSVFLSEVGLCRPLFHACRVLSDYLSAFPL